MKNSFPVLFFTFVIFSFSVLCQNNPSENVKKEFNKKYPSAQSVKWDSEESYEWEAEFTMGNKKMSACFDNSGKWMESETAITEKELPASVKNTLNRDFKEYKKGYIEIFESPEMKGFELGLIKGETSLEVIFDNNGIVINKQR